MKSFTTLGALVRAIVIVLKAQTGVYLVSLHNLLLPLFAHRQSHSRWLLDSSKQLRQLLQAVGAHPCLHSVFGATYFVRWWI